MTIIDHATGGRCTLGAGWCCEEVRAMSVNRRRELLIVQQVIGPLAVDHDRLSQLLHDFAGGYRSGTAGNPPIIAPDTDEDERTDCEWDLTSSRAFAKDEAAADADELTASVSAAHDALVNADRIRRKYLGQLPAVFVRPRGVVCGPCAAQGGTEPIRYAQTRVAARLDKPVDLCDWHYRWVSEKGHLPSGKQTRKHLDGKRVRKGK